MNSCPTCGSNSIYRTAIKTISRTYYLCDLCQESASTQDNLQETPCEQNGGNEHEAVPMPEDITVNHKCNSCGQEFWVTTSAA